MKIEWGLPDFDEWGEIPESAPVYEHLAYFFRLGNQYIRTNNGGVEIVYRVVSE